MGLGFKDLSMGDGFNIVDALCEKGSIPGGASQFSFYVTDGDDSEVTFGGYRPELLASDIVWAPVKVQSWWQVAIDDITFNNQPKSLCDGQCQVAVDTGTSMLAGPSDLVDKLTSMVDAKDDCSNFNELPNLGFKLGNTVLNLKPDDYMDRSDGRCSFSLMALDVPPPKGPVFIFGDPFLRRFVTIYDRTKPAVGFAVAKHSGTADEAGTSGLIAHIQGGGSSSSSSSPAGDGNPNAVDLHLDAGLMTSAGGGQDQEASSDSTKQETPQPPAPGQPNMGSDAAEASKPDPKPLSASDSDESSLAKLEADNFFASKSQDPAEVAPTSTEVGSPAVQNVAATGKSNSNDDTVGDMRQLLGLRSFIQKPRQQQHGLVSVRLYR